MNSPHTGILLVVFCMERMPGTIPYHAKCAGPIVRELIVEEMTVEVSCMTRLPNIALTSRTTQGLHASCPLNCLLCKKENIFYASVELW